MSEEEHGGGGHGGWIVTYSDMVTLLMACFIMVITFSSKEPEKYSRNRDSVIQGSGSLGPAGAEQKGLDKDAIVWRQRPYTARVSQFGSEMPPLYADPTLERTHNILRALEAASTDSVLDNYLMRLPLTLFFDKENKLSPSGGRVLHAIAHRVQFLPYDVLVQVDDARFTARAVQVAQHLAQRESIHPGRVGVGVRETSESWNPALWISYVRHP